MSIINVQFSSAMVISARQFVQDNNDPGAPLSRWVPVAAVGGFIALVTIPVAIWGSRRKIKKARKRQEEDQKRRQEDQKRLENIEEQLRRARIYESVGGRVELQTDLEAQRISETSNSPPELPSLPILLEISGALDPQELSTLRRSFQELPAESSIQPFLELDDGKRL